MNELIKIYEALMARGMKPQPCLYIYGSCIAHTSAEYDGRAGCLSDGDTRDLLTMHAMRWYTENCDGVIVEGKPRFVAATLMSAKAIVGCETMQQPKQGMILEAILAATAHL